MAERRMFSKRIINSARFLKMPVSTQCLYFHLGLHADDDGVVEAYTVMTGIGASEDDLRVLMAKGYVIVLNDDLVTYISDWNENNKIRADRKVDSIYKDLLLQILPDVSLKERRVRADVAKKQLGGQPMDNQWTTNGRHRIGKDRIGQDSIGEDIEPPAAIPPPKPVKHKHGEYNNVLLTDEDLDKLKAEFPDWSARIERLSAYIAQSGKSYKSHLATIRNWARKDAEQPKQERGGNVFLEMLNEERGI